MGDLTDIQTRVQAMTATKDWDGLTDTQLTYYINEAGRELHNLLVKSREERVFDTDTLTLVAGTEAYSLSSLDPPLANLLEVWYQEGSERVQLKRAPRKRFGLRTIDQVGRRTVNSQLQYRLMGEYLYFVPVPQAGGTVELWYVPRYVDLVATTNEDVPAWVPDTGLDFMVHSAAANVMRMQEDDPGPFVAKAEALRAELGQVAEDRDEGEPHSIVMVEPSDVWEDW